MGVDWTSPFTPKEGEGEQVTLEIPVLLPVHLLALAKLEAATRRYLNDYRVQGVPTLASLDLASKRFRKEAAEIIERIDEKGGTSGKSPDAGL